MINLARILLRGGQSGTARLHAAGLLGVGLAMTLLSCGAVTPEPADVVGSLTGASDHAAHLTASDPQDEQGRYVDQYTLDVEQGTIVRLSLRSDEFDTFLRVDTGGSEVSNDDFGAGTNSMIQFTVTDTQSPVTIDVSSFEAEATGAYVLSVDTRSGETVQPRLVLGETMTGALEDGGGGVGAGSPAATMWFEAVDGQRVELRVTSPDFDTTATLIAPSGVTWFNDDANDLGESGRERATDSTVRLNAPVSGLYQLIVQSYDGSPGNFRVQSQVHQPITVSEGQDRPEVGFAGRDSAGHIYGLFAGISSYGPDDYLFGCAADAENLAEAFRVRALQGSSDQIVLTEKSATRAAFEAGMRRIAASAGPEDVVVIFYSGHGGVEPVDPYRDRVELDGTDETMIFVDAPMTDNDFATLLDRVRAETIIVVMDSCQSGGFARDIMTHPGRIGIFSSDEDVLSSTAESLDAGGFLSAAFIDAVRGLADARPNDGALLAGELTDYLLEAGVEHHRQMNPQGSHSPVQRFVVERGSFAWQDPLWIFPQRQDGSSLDPFECTQAVSFDSAPVGGVCQ